MRTDDALTSYRNDLLLALRLGEVPGPRIAEALAEVDSHVAETREDPRTAFGPPQEYAAELLAVLAPGRTPGWRGWLGSLRASDLLGALVAAVGGWSLADGLFALASGTSSSLGLPAAVAAAVGLVLLAGLALVIVRSARGGDDRVLDPRTGADMAPPMPRWAVAVVFGLPVGMLVVAVVVGLTQR